MKEENPFSKIEDRNSESVGTEIMSFRRLSFLEKMGVISSLIMGMSVLVVASISLVIDFGRLNIVNIIADLILVIMGTTSLYFIYGIYRKKVIVETLLDTAFQEGIYNRLKPLINNISNSRVDADVMLDRMSSMDIKIENILKGQISKVNDLDKYEGRDTDKYVETVMQRQVTIGTSLGFIFKSIFMLIITMATFMFLVNFNLGSLTPFVTLSIFVLWWVFITNEYSLWKNTYTWLFISFPIAIIPVSVMILGNLVNYNILMAILYVTIGIYTVIYYMWAIYTTTGVIPFIRKREYNDDKKFFLSQQKGMLGDILTEVKKKS